MGAQYNKDSIQKLDPLSFTRLRPDTYCGSTVDSTQLVTEIVSNAVDEHLAGNGNKISVEINQNTNIVTVQDWGQGIIPNNKQGNKTTLEMVYGDINSSGKFDKGEDAVYKVSTGAFGIGAALTCFLSHYLIATTKRDGQYETVYFVEGKFDHRESGRCDKKEHGVTVTFLPSEEFFDSPIPNLNTLLSNAQKITCVCPKLTYIFNGQIIKNSNGLQDYIHSYLKIKPIINSDFILDETIGYRRLNMGLSVSEGNGIFDAFCNYSPIEAGTPITAIKSSITRTLNKWAQDMGILKSKDTLSGSSLQEGMVVVFNLVSKDIRYDSQTKVRVTSTSDNPFINEVVSRHLEIWLDNNPEDGKKIIEKAVLARRAAEAAKKAREAVRNQKAKKKKNKILHPDKLKDAEYLGQDSTLLIVEGLSAGASMAVARDVSKYGILMLRGKLINAFTNSESKLMKNEEIQLLLQALNIEPGNYDSSQLRYGRVAICTDSDSDGYNIGLLITVALQHFCPEFIQEGRLCWLRSPLYILKNKKKESYFFTDNELAAARSKTKLQGELQRNKGLGSLSAEQARSSMFGENQHIDVISPDEFSIVLLDKLMGTNVTARKKYIFENIDFAEVRE